MPFGSCLGMPYRHPVSAGIALNFASGLIPSFVKCTRASKAWAFNSAGNLAEYANNIPRIDYDPSGPTAIGLLVEPARTNSLRNSSCGGVVPGVLGAAGVVPTNWIISGLIAGVSITVTAESSENGVPYFDLAFSGTGAGTFALGFETTTNIDAATGQDWASSAFYKLVAGAVTNATFTHKLVERSAAGATLATTDTVLVPTTAALYTQRIVANRVFNQATTAKTNARVDIAISGAVSFTLRVGAPQLERGTYPSSPILTTTAAVTRAVENVYVGSLSGWFNPLEGTLYVAARHPYIANIASDLRIASFNNATLGNVIELGALFPSTYPFCLMKKATIDQAYNATASAMTANTVRKLAFAYKLNSSQFASGGTASAADTSCEVASPITRLDIGGNSAMDRNFGGHITALTYYPRRLTQAQLITLTT